MADLENREEQQFEEEISHFENFSMTSKTIESASQQHDDNSKFQSMKKGDLEYVDTLQKAKIEA